MVKVPSRQAPQMALLLLVATLALNKKVATTPPPTTSPTLPPDQEPSPPTSLASPSQSPTSITLSWEQPAGDAVDRYDIVYTYQGGCNPPPAITQFQGTATALPHTQESLEEFSSYSVMVTAVSSIGESAPVTGTFTTESSAPSAAPQNVRNTSVTISTITIQWDRVNCIDRNSEITGYTVRYGQTGSATTDMSVLATDDSDRTFTASGLTPGTSYEFQLAADNSADMTGVFSSSTTVETPALTVTLNGVVYTNNSVVHTGIVPIGEWYFPDGSQVLDGLDPSRNIFRNRGTSFVRLNRRNNAQSPSGLYRCEIPDASGTNRSIYINLIAGLVPQPPEMVALVPQSPTSITLSWNHPAVDTVDRYDIIYTYQGGCSDYTQPQNMVTVNGGTAREFTLQNLQEFSTYFISIAAVNSTGPSTPGTGEGMTLIDAPSLPPQPVVMVSVNATSIAIQWGRVNCIDRNSVITGYTVRYGQTGNTPTVMEPVTGTSDSDRMFTASGLIPRTSYTFEVAAVSSEGTGPFSMGIALETLEPETLLFQLHLTGSLNCLEWISDNIEAKRSSLRDTIVTSIQEEFQLQCGCSQSDITSDGFSECFISNAVTYRGRLHGTNTATASELAAYLEQWSARGVAFPVQSLILIVDSSCTVVIESLMDPECLSRFTDTTDIGTTETPSKTDSTASIVGGVVSVIVVIILAVTTVLIILLILRRAPKLQSTEEPVQLR